MTTFTTSDRENAMHEPTVIVDSGASVMPKNISIDHLKEFIEFGKTHFQQGALLFGGEFLNDSINIAEELLAIKERQK